MDNLDLAMMANLIKINTYPVLVITNLRNKAWALLDLTGAKINELLSLNIKNLLKKDQVLENINNIAISDIQLQVILLEAKNSATKIELNYAKEQNKDIKLI